MKKLMLITSFLIALIISIPITLAATQSLVYDANGNLVTGDSKYREYDGFNHLVRIRDGNNATGIVLENLTWHPIEERIVIKDVYQTNGSFVETIYYPTKEFVRVINATGSYDYNYIYQNGQLVAQEFVGEKKHFMLNDHKGTVQIVVNESGAKVEEIFYSPFGEIISGGTTSRFDYEGKEFDSVVGDYDYHARKYCPSTHTFCQPDTLLPNVYDPQQLNRYSFERNNPFKYVDEDGHIIQIYLLIELFVAITTIILTVLALKDRPDIPRTPSNEIPMQNNYIHNTNPPLEPAIMHDASPANKITMKEEIKQVEKPDVTTPKELEEIFEPFKKKDNLKYELDKQQKENHVTNGGTSTEGSSSNGCGCSYSYEVTKADGSTIIRSYSGDGGWHDEPAEEED